MAEAQKIKAYFDDLASGRRWYPGALYTPTTPIPAGIRGAINGILTRASGSDANRRLVLQFLAGVTSSRDLTGGQWYALYCLVLPFKFPEEGWGADNPNFDRALGAVLVYLEKQPAQQALALESDPEPVAVAPVPDDFSARLDQAIAALGMGGGCGK